MALSGGTFFAKLNRTAPFRVDKPDCGSLSPARTKYRQSVVYCPKPTATPCKYQKPKIDFASTTPFKRRFGTPTAALSTPSTAPAEPQGQRRNAATDGIIEKVKIMFSQRMALTGKSVARVIRNFDDGDGRISQEELARGIRLYLNKDLSQAEMDAVFAFFDDDGSGVITIDEIVAKLAPKSVYELLQTDKDPEPDDEEIQTSNERMIIKQPMKDASGFVWPSHRNTAMVWGHSAPRLSKYCGSFENNVAPAFDVMPSKALSPIDTGHCGGLGVTMNMHRRPQHAAIDFWERLVQSPTVSDKRQGFSLESVYPRPVLPRVPTNPKEDPAACVREGRGYRRKKGCGPQESYSLTTWLPGSTFNPVTGW